jgi:ABC-type sugar transport system ATPase subunit
MMNLFQGRIVRQENTQRFHCPDFSFDLGDVTLERGERGVEVGIRPEDIELKRAGETDLRATVEMTSDAGADKYVHARLGKSLVTVRAGKNAGCDAGQLVSLYFNPVKLHLFHEGRRIG